VQAGTPAEILNSPATHKVAALIDVEHYRAVLLASDLGAERVANRNDVAEKKQR